VTPPKLIDGNDHVADTSSPGFARWSAGSEGWSSICSRCLKVIVPSAPLSVVERLEETHACSAESVRNVGLLTRLARRKVRSPRLILRLLQVLALL